MHPTAEAALTSSPKSPYALPFSSPLLAFDTSTDSNSDPKPKAKPAAKKAAASKPAPKPRAKAPAKKPTQTTLKQTALKPKENGTAASKKRPLADPEDEDPDSHISSDLAGNDDSALSTTPPQKKAKAVAPPPKRAGSQPLGDLENEAPAPAPQPSAHPKSSADRFQRVCLSSFPLDDATA